MRIATIEKLAELLLFALLVVVILLPLWVIARLASLADLGD